MAAVMAVRAAEFRALVRGVPFLALPREEIDRLHASLEVLIVDERELPGDGALRALRSYVAVHYNYSWLTFPGADGQRTLLLPTALPTKEPAPLFLDDEMLAPVRRDVEARLELERAAYDVRLAAILQEPESRTSGVGLLSVAKLTGRYVREGVPVCGNGELRQARSQFDSMSQVVIDHLVAL